MSWEVARAARSHSKITLAKAARLTGWPTDVPLAPRLEKSRVTASALPALGHWG